MTVQQRPDDAKTKELILFIAERSADDPFFGAIKLNKILFFSDFLAYGHFGRSITGQQYFRLPLGPAPRRLLPIQREMEQAGDIVLTSPQRFAFRQKRIFPIRSAVLDAFSTDELDLVQEVIDLLKSKTATEASDISHDFLGWELVEDYATIPYSTVFLSRTAPDPDRLQRYRDTAVRRGWIKTPATV